jgi:hypothetical protein
MHPKRSRGPCLFGLVPDHVIGRHGHLADVELFVGDHPEEDLLRVERDVAQVDAGHRDPPVGEGAGPVVGPQASVIGSGDT